PQGHIRLTQKTYDLLRTMSLLHRESFPAQWAGWILSYSLDQFSGRGSSALTLLPLSCSVALPVVPMAPLPGLYAASSVEVITTSFGLPVVPIKAMLFLL
ncbi:MAG TPA: hypothetical protein VMJ32_07020, partial [Pirellulales bacterium]|nr:hypothetical protein [Pirellulales bacterium]